MRAICTRKVEDIEQGWSVVFASIATLQQRRKTKIEWLFLDRATAAGFEVGQEYEVGLGGRDE